jgi:uncharacterized protein with von Willebrand factor type A (vWA) domain
MPAPETDSPQLFSDNVVHFVRLLRAAGLPRGVDDVRAALEATAQVGLKHKEDFRAALETTLVRRPEELEIFEQAFLLFWRNPQGLNAPLQELLASIKSRLSPKKTGRRLAERVAQPFFGQAKAQAEGEPEVEVNTMGTGSYRERLWHRDFDSMSPEEFAEAKKLISSLAMNLPRISSRRRRPLGKGDIDWRQTIRARMRGDLRPRFRGRRRQPMQVLALCDISGSMSQYSRAGLIFLHALAQQSVRFESFTIGTRLTRVSRDLKDRDPDIALNQVAARAADWSGGTRLTDAMETFVHRWLRRVMSRPTLLILFSDGIDGMDLEPTPSSRSRIERLDDAFKRIRLSAQNIVWVNPLRRWPGYMPKAQAASVISRYADLQVSGHHMASLASLARMIHQLQH